MFQLAAVRARCSSSLLMLNVARIFAVSVWRPMRILSRISFKAGTNAMAMIVVAAINSSIDCPVRFRLTDRNDDNSSHVPQCAGLHVLAWYSGRKMAPTKL